MQPGSCGHCRLKANNVDLWLESTNAGGNAPVHVRSAEEVSGVWSGTEPDYVPDPNEDGAAVVGQARQASEREKALVQSILSTTMFQTLVAGWSADSLHNPGAIPLFPGVMPAGGGHDVPFLMPRE